MSMNELLTINVSSDSPTVSGRALHEALEVKTEYKKWFGRMSEYGFTDGEDFERVTQKRDTLGGEQNFTDHQLTIDMAKELCMLQRTEKGKECRRYFIEVEKAWNSPEAVMSRALQFANRQLEAVTKERDKLKPAADYAHRCLLAENGVPISSIAKEVGMSGQVLNKILHGFGVQYRQGSQWLLYAKYDGKGYVVTNTYPVTHKDGTEDVRVQTLWTQTGSAFILKLLSDNGITQKLKPAKPLPPQEKFNTAETFVNAVKEKIDSGMSMAYIARQAGIHPVTLRRYIRGETKPSVEMMEKVRMAIWKGSE